MRITQKQQTGRNRVPHLYTTKCAGRAEAEQRVDPLVEPGLCMAMWDMYLGQEAISADIKRGFVAGERRREAALCGREVVEEEEEGGGLDVGGVASAAAGATQQAFGALSSGAGALAGSIHWPRRRGQG